MKRIARKAGMFCAALLAASALVIVGCSDPDTDDGQKTEQGPNADDKTDGDVAGGDEAGDEDVNGGDETGDDVREPDGDGESGGDDAVLILADARLKGTMNDWELEPLEKDSDTVYTYTFTASSDSGEFTVLRTSDQDDGGWGDGTVQVSAPKASEDAVGSSSEPVELIHKESGYPDNIKLSGLSANCTYTLVFKVVDAASNAVSASIRLDEYAAPPTAVDVYVNGPFGSENVGSVDIGTSKEFTYEFVYKDTMGPAWGNNEGELGFLVAEDAKNSQKYGKADAGDVIGKEYVTLQKGADGNNLATGLEDGETYIITVLFDTTGDTYVVKAKIDKK